MLHYNWNCGWRLVSPTFQGPHDTARRFKTATLAFWMCFECCNGFWVQLLNKLCLWAFQPFFKAIYFSVFGADFLGEWFDFVVDEGEDMWSVQIAGILVRVPGVHRSMAHDMAFCGFVWYGRLSALMRYIWDNWLHCRRPVYEGLPPKCAAAFTSSPRTGARDEQEGSQSAKSLLKRKRSFLGEKSDLIAQVWVACG